MNYTLLIEAHKQGLGWQIELNMTKMTCLT